MTFRKGRLVRSKDTGRLYVFERTGKSHLMSGDKPAREYAVVRAAASSDMWRININLPLHILEPVANNYGERTMKTLKDHQDTMVSMLASGTAIPTSAIRLAHALHDVLAHLNNTNVAPVAHTERRIDATTPGLNDAMLAQDIAAVKPKQQSLESLLKQRDNTIRQLKGRVSVLRTENEALEQEVMNLRKELHCMPELPEQAGVRKEDTQTDDGWIEWGGGECPAETGTLVDVRYRDGLELYALPANECQAGPRNAQRSFWRHEGMNNDIIAYRVVNP